MNVDKEWWWLIINLGFNSGYLYQVGIRPSLAALAPGRMLPIPVAFAALGTVNGGLGCASLCLDLRAVHPPAPPGRRPSGACRRVAVHELSG